MRALRRLTLLAIAIAVFAWLRKVLSEEVVERLSEAEPATVPEPEPEPVAAPAEGPSDDGEPTKAELYERAQELGIRGRSKMSKQELERAIREAG